jgi:hypothetical protein
MDYRKLFITNYKILSHIKLNYLIAIPCVNREERNAINVIDKTFEGFEKSGLFSSNIKLTILLFESGSKDKSYLDFIEKYIEKYCFIKDDSDINNIKYSKTNIDIKIIHSHLSLNGNSNTYRMFLYISKMQYNLFDFVIWMDDDIFVSKNFIKNADAWIKNYANFSLFSSLYVPYNTFPIKNYNHVEHANLPGFYGTCCTIFKPMLSLYVLPFWHDEHFEKFKYNPDARFRDCLRKYFPHEKKICVSSPSLIDHMNIGSSIEKHKKINSGHKAKLFVGIDNDLELYNKI